MSTMPRYCLLPKVDSMSSRFRSLIEMDLHFIEVPAQEIGIGEVSNSTLSILRANFLYMGDQ